MTDKVRFIESQLAETTHADKSERDIEMSSNTNEMKPSSSDRSQRLAELRASRPSMNIPESAPIDSTRSSSAATAKRRATLGKIFATGLTSTTIFGLTAALGFASAQGSAGENIVPQTQYVLDMTTGQLVTYVNGIPTTATQVMAAPSATQVSGVPAGAAPLDLSGFGQVSAPVQSTGTSTASPVGTTAQPTASQPTASQPAASQPAAGVTTPVAVQPALTPVAAPVAETVPAPVVATPVEVAPIPIAIPTPAVTVPAPQGNSSGTKA